MSQIKVGKLWICQFNLLGCIEKKIDFQGKTYNGVGRSYKANNEHQKKLKDMNCREQLTIDSHAISKNIGENQKHQRETESSNIQQLNAESLISKSFCYYNPSSLISMVHMAHDAIEKEMSDEMVQKNLVLEHEKIKLLSFNNEQASIINEIPKSIDTLKKRFGIETFLIETVCCNLCFKLYDIEKSHAKDDLLEQHKSWQLQMKSSAEILKTFEITGPCQN
ncbi:hypothetical protein BY996DRAFT_8687742 [Phakopsora pachyrhizi]|nr:hypothetical protein BY996DRAFT_8687742 [Phakopsora pachyrhizi]